MKLKQICICICAFCLAVTGGLLLYSPPSAVLADETDAQHGGLTENMPVYGNLYTESSDKYLITDAAMLGVQFYAVTEFDTFEVYIEKATASRSSAVVSLYRWNTNYGTTLSQPPVCTETISKFGRNEWISLSAANQLPAGEYAAVVSEISNAAVGVVSAAPDNIRNYEGYSQTGGVLMGRIRYLHTPVHFFGAISEPVTQYRTYADTYAVTDGLDRTAPLYAETGGMREGKFVGIFYHTWHSRFYTHTSSDITEILSHYTIQDSDYTGVDWGNSFSYFWNKPLFGYYSGLDTWVLRKHAELLADAGVDVVIFDNTNATDTFMEGLLALLETFSKARADGVKTPQISFMLPMFGPYEDTAAQLRELYTKIYSMGRYQDLWFYWKGKPLMMGCPDALDPYDEIDRQILDFFTFRPANPAYREDYAQIFDENGNVSTYIIPPQNHICWQWIATYPQTVARNADGSAEQMCVSIAQNWSAAQGLTAMNAGDQVFGRSYSAKLNGHDQRENAKLYGANFAEQWEYALEVDPEFIFITGWNELRAGKNDESWGTVNGFADLFNDNYSRDIEPSAGDLKDHYYYQMVSYIRRFKGTNRPAAASGQKQIDIFAQTDQWTDVTPYFTSYSGNTEARDSQGYDQYYYTDETGRNDIIGAKVARDAEHLYFMVETAEALTPVSDPGWMRLFIEVEGAGGADWEGYQYIINRGNPGEKAILERSTGGWNWENVGEVDYSVQGSRLQLAVPKALLKIEGDDFTINFKWSDNMQTDGDIMDLYLHGDAAPGGRFKYQYRTVPKEPGPANTAPSGAALWKKALLIGCFCLAGAGIAAAAAFALKKKKKQNHLYKRVS